MIVFSDVYLGMSAAVVNATPQTQWFNNGSNIAIPNIKIIFMSVSSIVNGVATFYATSDGTSTGTPCFSTVLHAEATPWANTATLTSCPYISGKSIGSDQKTLTFNVLVANSVLVGGISAAFAPNATALSCMIVGLP